MKTLLTAALLAIAMAAGIAQAAPTAQLEGGRTTVKLSEELVDALGTLDVAPSAIAPAKLKAERGLARFPIPGGAVDLDTLQGEIQHVGGLLLEGSDIAVALFNFVIDTTGDTPVLTGLASVNGDVVGRIPLFALSLERDPKVTRWGTLILRSVTLTLTPEAAEALNTAFGVTAFAEGLDVGRAFVKSRIGSLFGPYGEEDGNGGEEDNGYGDGEDNGYGNGEDNGYGDGEDNGYGNGEDNGYGNGKDDGYGNGEDNGTDDDGASDDGAGNGDGYGDGEDNGTDDDGASDDGAGNGDGYGDGEDGSASDDGYGNGVKGSDNGDDGSTGDDSGYEGDNGSTGDYVKGEDGSDGKGDVSGKGDGNGDSASSGDEDLDDDGKDPVKVVENGGDNGEVYVE